jgi:hypothetical protein
LPSLCSDRIPTRERWRPASVAGGTIRGAGVRSCTGSSADEPGGCKKRWVVSSGSESDRSGSGAAAAAERVRRRTVLQSVDSSSWMRRRVAWCKATAPVSGSKPTSSCSNWVVTMSSPTVRSSVAVSSGVAPSDTWRDHSSSLVARCGHPGGTYRISPAQRSTTCCGRSPVAAQPRPSLHRRVASTPPRPCGRAVAARRRGMIPVQYVGRSTRRAEQDTGREPEADGVAQGVAQRPDAVGVGFDVAQLQTAATTKDRADPIEVKEARDRQSPLSGGSSSRVSQLVGMRIGESGR